MAVEDLVRAALRKGAKKPSAKAAYKAEFDPRQFYHGSFEDIKAFDPERAYPGSFMGRGQYITTSPVDAYKNYAHPSGGDVTAKIDNLVERAGQYAEDLAQGLKHEDIAKFYQPQEIELAKTVLKTDPNLGELAWDRRSDYLADAAIRQLESAGNITPLKARLGNVLRESDDPETFREVKDLAGMGDEDFAVAKLLKERGYDSVEHDPTVHFRMGNLEANPYSGGKPAMHYMVPDPTRLRSPWAKFDPKKKGSSDLLALNGKGEGMGKAVISALRSGANAASENPYLTLDPEKGREANFWADLGVGMLPIIGTAQAGRDFERARREGSALGMGLAAVSAIPIGGKPVAMAAKALRKGAKVAEEALPKVAKAKKAAQAPPARPVSFDPKNPETPVLLGRSAEEKAALKAATDAEAKAAALRKQAGQAPFPQLATRYPQPGAPTWELKNKKQPELGAYLAKGPSGESAAFMAERQAIQKQMEAEGFPRYFDPAQRVNADVSFYPTTETTIAAAKPKTAKTEQAWREKIQTPEAAARIEDAVKLADEVGGGDKWYFMGQLQQKYIDELGPEEGARRFKEDFADKMAATTGGADPGDNWLMAAYHNYVQGQGKLAPERAFEIPQPVGGRYISGNMEMANKVASGTPLTAADQPKRFNFSRNFQGDEAPATIDERMTQLINPGKNAPEGDSYFAFEEMLSPPGASAANKGSRLQDRAWLGHKLRGDLEKGVPREKLEPGKPMVEWINESIHRTSKLTGLSPDEVVRGWIKRTTPAFGLAGAGLGTAALVGALRNEEQQTL